MTAENRKGGLSAYEIIAILSSVGLICWMITDFFGGMFIWLLSYAIIVIPFILLYCFSFFETLFSLFKKGKRTSQIKLAAHGVVLSTILIFSLFNSEIFKSEIIMTATLKDDQSHFRIVLRENGVVENRVNGMFGFSKTFYGKYKIENDLIIFSEKPYNNDFIPDTLLIDRVQGAIFMEKNSAGNFRIEKEWLNHFTIEESNSKMTP